MDLKKYKIYYFINEDKTCVEVIRILHSLQNESKELLADDTIYPVHINEETLPYKSDDEVSILSLPKTVRKKLCSLV